MKNRGDVQIKVFLLLVIVMIFGGYFLYQKYFPKVLNVLPPATIKPNTSAVSTEKAVILEPKANSVISSPLTVRGTVPPGWMFEGSFPIKLTDSAGKTIVQTQATEEVPGSWQSNATAYFIAKITFTTTAKTGFIILENDNPSGDPAKAKSFKLPISF